MPKNRRQHTHLGLFTFRIRRAYFPSGISLHVTLSRSKFQVDTCLNFARCVVSHCGVKPDPARISALSNFHVPTDQTSARLFLGLCNQLAFFVPDFQHHTAAMRQLTGKGRPFLWLPEHQVEFDKLKDILSSNLIVRHFDHKKHVYLLTDASRLFGLGYPRDTLNAILRERKYLRLCTVDLKV